MNKFSTTPTLPLLDYSALTIATGLHGMDDEQKCSPEDLSFLKLTQARIDRLHETSKNLTLEDAQTLFSQQQAEWLKFCAGEPNEFESKHGSEVRSLDAIWKDLLTRSNTICGEISRVCDEATLVCNSVNDRCVAFLKEKLTVVEQNEIAQCQEWGIPIFTWTTHCLRKAIDAMAGRIQKRPGHAQWPKYLLDGLISFS